MLAKVGQGHQALMLKGRSHIKVVALPICHDLLFVDTHSLEVDLERRIVELGGVRRGVHAAFADGAAR